MIETTWLQFSFTVRTPQPVVSGFSLAECARASKAHDEASFQTKEDSHRNISAAPSAAFCDHYGNDLLREPRRTVVTESTSVPCMLAGS